MGSLISQGTQTEDKINHKEELTYSETQSFDKIGAIVNVGKNNYDRNIEIVQISFEDRMRWNMWIPYFQGCCNDKRNKR